MDDKHIGSNFDDFLEEEGIKKEVEQKSKIKLDSLGIPYITISSLEPEMTQEERISFLEDILFTSGAHYEYYLRKNGGGYLPDTPQNRAMIKADYEQYYHEYCCLTGTNFRRTVANYEKSLKYIDGYIGRYQVSDKGDVYSIKPSGTIKLKPQINSNGYYYVNLCKNGNRKVKRIHILVASAFIPNPENKHDVDHKDGNRLNNNLNNLRWCTRGENMQNLKRPNKIKKTGLPLGVQKTYNGKFRAELTLNGKMVYSSYCDSIEEATVARTILEQKYYTFKEYD